MSAGRQGCQRELYQQCLIPRFKSDRDRSVYPQWGRRGRDRGEARCSGSAKAAADLSQRYPDGRQHSKFCEDRTLCDNVVILHGLRRWYAILGQVRGNGQRISRHYYDLYRLLQSEIGRAPMANLTLTLDCVAHARIFFNRPDFALGSAHPPTFALGPEGGMVDDL